MCESKQYAIDYYCRDYDDIVSTINGFSDEEISLIVDKLPDDYDNLQNAICEEIEAGIFQILCDNLVIDLADENFYECFEEDIIDYLTGEGLSYESYGYYEDKQVQINNLNQEIEKNATLITKTISFMNKLKDIIG